ncbi:MAG: hypothetical protein D6704_06650 [Nitrospirae bacterium]|nr:MAG: hypothetical protein D6704_06650 [Nitrospirota bacterium]
MSKHFSLETEPASWHGTVVHPKTPAELAGIVERAFDYRGDVTLKLKTGESLVGYVYNRQPHSPCPYLDIMLASTPDRRRVPYHQITAIIFSGEDMAFGRSWEAWQRKKQEETQKIYRPKT